MSKMKISEILKQADDKFGITEIVNDVEFETLALVIADIGLSYCTFLDDEKYIASINDKAKLIITTRAIAKDIKDKGICISENPRISFFKLHNYLTTQKNYRLTKEFETIIGKNCNISNLASIATKNVKIGNNVTIEEFASIKENTVIGDNTFIGSGTVVGGGGFEFKRLENSEVLNVKHCGWTKIGNNVDIQHNTCIDKAIYPWDETTINDYCKIDNLVHIAHGVKLDKAVMIVAGVLLGGRTVIKENSWIGVGATVSNGLIIGKDSKVNIGAVATRSIEDNMNVSGNFAIEHKKFIEFIKSIR